MATKLVTVKTEKSAGLIMVVRIDGVKLLLDGHGKAEKAVKADAIHAIDFFVRGQPGGNYAVAITAPVEARFRHAATLDGDQLDIGHEYFFVGEVTS